MMNNQEDHPSSSLEVIRFHDREPRQFALTNFGQAYTTYKMVRTPSTINELVLPHAEETVVWMDNRTMAVLTNGNRSDRPVITMHKRLKLHWCPCVSVEIFGDTEDSVLETAVFFDSLPNSEDRVLEPLCISFDYTAFNFDVACSEQLAIVIERNRAKKILFMQSKLNKELSAMLASRPFSVNLGVYNTPMDIDAFMEHLQARSTPFGSLALDHWTVRDVFDIGRLFDHLNLFDHLDLPDLTQNLLWKLLSSSVKSICFKINRETEGVDLRAADIVPKHIAIRGSESSFSKQFMLSFFHRVAEIGHLESLKLTCDSYSCGPADVDVGEAFIQAVVSNKNLKILELKAYGSLWENCAKDILAGLEMHKGLHTLRMDAYPRMLDPGFSWLKRLLHRNRQIEITGLDTNTQQIYTLSRLSCGSPRLTKESPMTRLLLVGAALTSTAPGDLQRIGLLLADHTDAVCDLLQDIVFTGDADENIFETTEEMEV